MLLASISANGLNYLFNLSMNRLLPPAEYGALSSLLALFMILAIPAISAGTVTAQYVSRLHVEGAPADVATFLVDVLKYLGGYGLVLFAVLWLLARPAAKFLQLASNQPVVMLATAMLPAVALPVAQGGLQGQQRFGALSANMVLATGSRLGIGLLLVSGGLGVSGALAASTVSGLLALFCALWVLRPTWQTHRHKSLPPKQRVLQYATAALWGTLAFTVLANADVLLVKHFFSPEEAGYYSTAATLGRIILYLPVAVATVMFPKAAESHARDESASKLARESILVAMILCAPFVVLYFAFPKPLVALLFGDQYVPCASLVGPMGLVMALLAISHLLLLYYLSIRDRRFVIVVVCGAVCLVLGLYAFHSDLDQVMTVLGVAGAGMLLAGEGWCRGVVGQRRL